MIANVRLLYTTRDLVIAWTYRIIRGRYQQSVLGGLWAIIQPAATVAIFSLIFTYIVPVDTGDVPYMVFSYVAMVPWTLFASSVIDMVDSLVGNMNLVSRIYFPREVLPLSYLLARLVDFAIAYAVVVVLLIYFRLELFLVGWLCLPLVLLVQLSLALGIGLAGAALNVFYRDVRHVFTLVIQLWFYASPIIYPVSEVKSRLPSHYYLYYLNPMTGVIEGYRDILLNQRLPGPYLALSAAVAVALLLFGYWLFKRVEFQFADVV